jgi:hypothetical protein
LYNFQEGIDTGWANSERLKAFAQSLELDEELFNSCVDSGKFAKRVQFNINEAKKQGATGTPTFIIVNSNGQQQKLVGAQPYSVFQKVFIFLEPYIISHIPSGSEFSFFLIVTVSALSGLVLAMNVYRINAFRNAPKKKMGGGILGSLIGAAAGACSCGPIGFAVISTFGVAGHCYFGRHILYNNKISCSRM